MSGVDADDVLAAYTRLRPFQLAGELVHHAKVMNAIGYLAQNETPEFRTSVKELARAWKEWPGKRWSIITADGPIDDVALTLNRPGVSGDFLV